MSGLLRIAISVWKTCGLPTVNLFRADLKGEFVMQFICLFFQQEKALHLSQKSLIGHGDEFHDHSFGELI